MTPSPIGRLLCHTVLIVSLLLSVTQTTRGGDPVKSKQYWQARVAAAIASRRIRPAPTALHAEPLPVVRPRTVPPRVDEPVVRRRWFKLYGAKWCKYCPQAESNVKEALKSLPVDFIYVDCTNTVPPPHVKSLPCMEWQSDHPSGKNYCFGVLSPDTVIRTWEYTQKAQK